jgi:hypothetical protein
MDKLLSGLNWFVCLCYLDDICVVSRTFDQHMERLVQVIERWKAAGLKLNPEKCSVFSKQDKVFGKRSQ